ncbi:hypothetical protein EGI88_15205 [Empedobacter falsenii]|uniref:Uncharacterized protein n=2 Tax=Empedobacter falsenii TaxID=343874 RepID=A0A427BDT1_9FLAO|nr:hypothetical protein [Empedobacter falsenii]RRT86283.1 hypothetical protein EGI88_15205 [Empedobacter falsenii]RRT86940.1 hypothetical protein EGI89_15175 [Empedobacter falsenii]
MNEELEKNVLENGLKKSFIGTVEQIIDKMNSFFIDVQLENKFKNLIILNIINDPSGEVTMDEIGLINDAIQKGIGSQASIVMNIEEKPLAEIGTYEIEISYLFE